MDRLISSVLLLWLLVFCQIGNVQAQAASENLQEEIIRITSSDELFVSGSNLYYQVLATFQDNSLSDISKVAEVGLYNAAGERLDIQKVFLKDGVGNGKFFIGSTLPSGEYFLIAATGWSMNNNKHPKFADREFLLINPFQPLPSNDEGAQVQVSYKTEDSGSSNKNIQGVSISTNKGNYGLRERWNSPSGMTILSGALSAFQWKG